MIPAKTVLEVTLYSSIYALASVVFVATAENVEASRELPGSANSYLRLRHGQDDCTAPPMHRVRQANLTTEDLELLPLICWREKYALENPRMQTRKGVPQGVQCKASTWCDDAGLCTEVCERGSVVIERWLSNAIHTQLQLARQVPFCLAALLGTHNSAITLADGFGNRDEYFQEYFKWIKWVSGNSVLRTSDQYLSLTDQLNLGVRVIELDTHWVEGELRIAHCGGFHAAPVNLLIRAVNVVASLLGHPIHWDTETVGCNPSLSSIPVTLQRSFADALAELSSWLFSAEHQEEFLVVFLDEQMDIYTWGYLPEMLEEIQRAFPLATIYTPPEHAGNSSPSWPSISELLALGKRIMFVSGMDYGPPMASLLFERKSGTVCGWQEPPLADFEAAPVCTADRQPEFHGNAHTLTGTLFRVTTCELLYGPLNCGFIWKSDNMPVLDELSLPAVAACGVNMPSPDLLTPERAAAAIWSWAPGHPFAAAHRQERWHRLWCNLLRWLRHGLGMQQLQDDAQCAAISQEDGRWRARQCSEQLPSACRERQGTWVLAQGPRGSCPAGTAFDVPHHAKENLALKHVLQKSNVPAAWLPLQGPKWQIPTRIDGTSVS